MTLSRAWWTPLGLWLAVMAAGLIFRPPLPVDETRYLAVAWEMWRDGNFLVPHLNGEAYSHKPPLLFWLINLGWGAFGVNDWWPRMVAPLFGLGSLFLTGALARRLWPTGEEAARAAPVILFGCVFWTLYTTLTMFDMILAFFALMGLIGVVGAWRGGGRRGFALLGLSIGLGLLTKGPAILVHVLPAALLAPWWGPALGPAPSGSWGRWYAGVAAAFLGAAALALAWAVPAALAGGDAYAEAIFWGQSAGRMVESFAHGRPWWWYAAMLPPMVLPWAVWPPLWRGLAGVAWSDGGVRFCLGWFAAAFAVFSLISGKQPHYLLPLFPALALVAARALPGQGRPVDLRIPGLAAAAAWAAAFVYLEAAGSLPRALEGVAPPWTLMAAAAGLACVFLPRPRPTASVVALAGLSAVMVTALHLALASALESAYDLRPLAARLGAWERDGVALAHFGKYHGQYQFLGRLEKPMAVIGVRDPDERDWLRRHPGGKVVSYRKTRPESPSPVYMQPFRGGYVVVWDAAAIVASPGLADRES